MNMAAMPTGAPFPITEGVIVAMCGVIVALLGLIGKAVYDNKRETTSIKKDVKETKFQVANDHSTNLREDVDDKHFKTIDAVQKVDRKVTRAFGEISTTNKRLNSYADRFNNTDRNVAQLRSDMNNRFDEIIDMIRSKNV